jgi:hypothetical protein
LAYQLRDRARRSGVSDPEQIDNFVRQPSITGSGQWQTPVDIVAVGVSSGRLPGWGPRFLRQCR